MPTRWTLARHRSGHGPAPHFSRLIGLVEAGEEIILQRDDHPVAKIVPYPSDAHARKAGTLKGQITIADDFDAIPEGFEDYVG